MSNITFFHLKTFSTPVKKMITFLLIKNLRSHELVISLCFVPQRTCFRMDSNHDFPRVKYGTRHLSEGTNQSQGRLVRTKLSYYSGGKLLHVSLCVIDLIFSGWQPLQRVNRPTFTPPPMTYVEWRHLRYSGPVIAKSSFIPAWGNPRYQRVLILSRLICSCGA